MDAIYLEHRCIFGRLAGVSALALLLLVPVGCGGGGEGGASASSSNLPVSQPTGPVDQALAERGRELFRTRGCTACHTLGEGKRVGPDLEGVTERREFVWLYHMVMSPDSMVKHDPEAKKLLGEYMVPMADQDVSPEQFRAIYEYLRDETREADEHEEEESR